MALDLDLYAPCPCGSGKKLKWCCQHIFVDIERAFEQAERGQFEAALRIMDGVIKAHPDNPEAWGRKAQLLFAEDRIDEGEEALQKAFDINPNYPRGLLMRASLRFSEGEVGGALILARRAAESFDPGAHDYLFQVYQLIADCEMRRNRPVAAHAALRLMLRYQPGEQQLREALEAAFGPRSRFPECARHVYTFLSPPADATGAAGGERRKAWDAVLDQVDSPRLGTLAAAFEQLTVQDPADPAAWFNLGLVQAWLGENHKGLAALDKYLELEEDDGRAAIAAALGEVLRCGQGLEDESDHCEYAVDYQIREVAPVDHLLREWLSTQKMMVIKTEQEGVVAALVFEPLLASVVTTAAPTAQEKKLVGVLILIGDQLRLTGPRGDAIRRLQEEIKTRAGGAVAEGPLQTIPSNFGDVLADAIVYPAGPESAEMKKQRVAEYARTYFEETWIRQPLRSLSGVAPVDAVGHRLLRKKLLGVVQFLQDCAGSSMVREYDFSRLRRKLGLGTGPGAAAPGTAAASGTGTAADVSAMGAAELAALSVESLSDQQLEQAYQAAQKLDAGELSGHFARALVGRPFPAVPTASAESAARPVDRYPWYAHLVQQAISEGNTDEALNYVNEGERADCEHNQGRRRNDYELRRGQVHVKRGEADLAHDVFTRLIERVPDNLKVRGTAAEGMLSLRQPERARRFAEDALAVARQQNDRDAERAMMELVDAARRQAEKG
jgi:tetratricopeptide (TPR) repeat protein